LKELEAYLDSMGVDIRKLPAFQNTWMARGVEEGVVIVALDATGRGLVPLPHELKIVTDYLEIEHTRLAERLTWSVDVPSDVAPREVPPLAVQTLVENSVKHAIAPRPGGGRVRVDARVAGDRLVLSVWDDGPGFTELALSPGHGLDSLRQRLAARFGEAAALTIGRRDGGTQVTLSLPAGPAR